MSFPPPPGPGQNQPPAQPPHQPPPQPYQPPYQQQPTGYQHPQGPPPGQPDPSGQPPYPGYPQPQPQYPGGAPWMAPWTGPMRMPGTVKTARVLLFVFGGLSTLGALFLFYVAANADNPDVIRDLGGKPDAGQVTAVALLALAVAATAILSASLFGRGAGGVRALAIVAGSLYCLMGLLSLSGGAPIGILTLAAGILIIVFTANSHGGAWFKRPRG